MIYNILMNYMHLAPGKLAIPYDMLSDCCKIADEYRIKVDDIMKLIPNLGGKTNYVLHCKTLSCICLQE